MTSTARPARPRISAVVCCYGDAPAIPDMYRRLRQTFARAGVEGEIVYVDNGSRDDAAEVLGELARHDPHLVVVSLSRNFGSQSAFTSGMRLASGDAVVLLDGDLQDPPELIEEMVARWREGYDVVYGERIQREASLPMQLAFKAFYRLYRRLSYIDIPVDAGDFSLIDRRVLNVLNTLPEKNRFVRGLRAWVGFRQTAVRYVRPERPYGRSTNNLVRNLGWARKAIFSFSFAPLELITVLALVTVATSFLAIVTEIAIRLLRPQWVPPGLTTVIVIILFMGGIQLLCLSIIGSYLAHIYDEVKGRPPYVVNRVINPPKATGGERRAKPVSRSD